MNDETFIGAWRLISQISIAADGAQTLPRGEAAHGIILYDASGWMSVFLTRAEIDPDARFGDYGAALHQALAYYGRYQIDRERRVVTHHLEGCTYPGWVGTVQVREYAFEGSYRLTLTARTLDALGALVTRVLIWERLQPG